MWLEIIIGLATIVVLFYLYVTSKWKYWTKRGIYQVDNVFPFGSFPAFFTKKEAFNDIMLRHVDDTKGQPFYGAYFFTKPILMLTDADLIKQVLVKDFDHFVDRDGSGGFMKTLKQSNARSDKIMLNQMTTLTGDDWKNLRTTFSPIFTRDEYSRLK